jgi:hypothetical protein
MPVVPMPSDTWCAQAFTPTKAMTDSAVIHT